MKLSDITLKNFVLSEIQANCYVVNVKDRSDCVVIDPGDAPYKVIRHMKEANLTPAAILITHGHFDHFCGVPEIKENWPNVPIYIGKGDRPKLANPITNLSIGFGLSFSTSETVHELQDNDTIEVAGLTFKTIEVPGHSSGHVVYILKTEERSLAFCGDVIFAGSIGRTDFPDGDGAALIRNIREKILTLPSNTLLCTGHGPVTSVAEEMRSNPFI
ncbi:MAG: MBL fold metallo-hydrolase [Thermoguttaceae bacterium]|jgi:hydroxyacylglutathione hydrolase